jgi:hypothetical protein
LVLATAGKLREASPAREGIKNRSEPLLLNGTFGCSIAAKSKLSFAQKADAAGRVSPAEPEACLKADREED